MNEVYEVVGLRKFETKRGTIGTSLYLLSRFTDYEMEHSVEYNGLKVQSEYISGSVDCSVGDKVILVFGRGFEGKAVVNGVQVVTPKK